MKNHTNNTIIIAIDIDDFLTSMETKELRKKEWLDPVHHSENHFIMAEFKHHDRLHQVENVLTPGCIEFFRFLFEHDNIRPAFFSAGIRARNVDLAKKIVQKAVDAGGDPTWLNRYDVYSREDCFDTERLHFNIDTDMRPQRSLNLKMGNGQQSLLPSDALKTDTHLRDVPVIFISALGEVEDKVKGFSAGGVDYINKPFQMEEVLVRVKTHLTLKNLTKELKEKNTRLQQSNEALQGALDEIKTLRGIIPICCHCKKIRDDKGYWEQIDAYISEM